MSTPVVPNSHRAPLCHHASSEEYKEFVYGYTQNRDRRRLLLQSQAQFMQRYPDLRNWFRAPLTERVGRLHGEDIYHSSYQESYQARRLSTQGRSRHPYLDSTFKMLQDDTPPGVGLGTAPVTLIHDNNVKEVTREIAIGTGTRFIIGHCLIGGEENIMARCCLPSNAITRITEWREFIIHRLA